MNLAPTRLSAAEVQRGLRYSIIEGAITNVFVSVTVGALLTGVALLLGAGPFELGVIGALPFVGQLFQFVGAYLEERLPRRRPMTVATAGISRGLWLIVAVLPLLPWLGSARATIFLLVLAVSQALSGIAANAWTSWMSDLVPARQRGRYFGVRNTIGALTAAVATWGSGQALDMFRANGQEAQGYAIIFGVATLSALVGIVVLARQPEPPKIVRAHVSVRELFTAPLRHARFRALSMAATGWAMATGIAAPFFYAHGLGALGISFTTLALQAALTSAVSIITQPQIGRLQDRLGDRIVLIGSVVGVVLLPWGWVLSTPDNLLPLWCTSFFSGIFWPGINQGLLNLLMDRAPAEGRGAYVASYGAVTGIGVFVAGLIGGALASLIGSTPFIFGGLLFTQYTILFALSSAGRLAMAFVFARML